MKKYHARPFLAFFIKVGNEIKVVSKEEIRDKNKLYKIAIDTIKKDGKCVLIFFNKNNNFNEQAFTFALNKHSHTQSYEVQHAKENVQSIRGYIELVDVSSYFNAFLY